MPVERKGILIKVCLYGDFAVGKTSLIKRFVLDQYDDKYLATIGAKVTKKVVTIDVPKKNLKVDMTLMLWDIMGQKGFRKLLEDAYFDGAKALIAVCDITRKSTLTDLTTWKPSISKSLRKVPTVIFANKCDLHDRAEVTERALKAIAKKIKAPYFYTSAKTGENVENGFRILSDMLVAKYF